MKVKQYHVKMSIFCCILKKIKINLKNKNYIIIKKCMAANQTDF